MRKMISSVLTSTFFCLLPIAAIADEAVVRGQVEGIAGGLVERLPLDQKIVIKALSPEESGLPEDFLRKLSSDLEAALLLASEFEINLANRLTTEDLWAEAVEFGDADFAELYAASQADIVLMIAPRATGAGVEISVTAYRLLGDDAGQVIASSGSVVLAIDMENSLGVDVNSLNDQMVQVLQEIEKVGQTGGLITDPNTYAEFYHNARVLQQRGEVDLAMRNYEQALAEGYLFVDPLLDLLKLANARYGEAGTQQYFERRIKENLPEELANVALVQLELASVEDIYSVEEIAEGSVFSPVLAVWLGKQAIQEIADSKMYYERKYEEDYYFMQSSRLVIHSYQIAEFQSYFIDKVAGTDLVNVTSLKAALEKLNRFEFAVYRVDYQEFSAQQHLRIAECKIWFNEQVSMAESLSLEIVDRTPVSIERTIDRLGARPMCTGINYEYDSSNYWTKDGVRVFNEDDGFLLSGNIATGETSECPFMPQFDRLLFAEMCGEQEYNVIGQLLITDNVDASLPIIVRLGLSSEGPLLFYETDISVDGTYVSSLPAPIGAYSGEGEYYFKPHPNNWFFAQGVLQSSIQTTNQFWEVKPKPAIFQISYTDIYGNRQTTRNSVISQLSCCFSDHDNRTAYPWEENYDGSDGFYPIVRSNNELVSVLDTTLGGIHRSYD